jgi:hypothetical protein
MAVALPVLPKWQSKDIKKAPISGGLLIQLSLHRKAVGQRFRDIDRRIV